MKSYYWEARARSEGQMMLEVFWFKNSRDQNPSGNLQTLPTLHPLKCLLPSLLLPSLLLPPLLSPLLLLPLLLLPPLPLPAFRIHLPNSHRWCANWLQSPQPQGLECPTLWQTSQFLPCVRGGSPESPLRIDTGAMSPPRMQYQNENEDTCPQGRSSYLRWRLRCWWRPRGQLGCPRHLLSANPYAAMTAATPSGRPTCYHKSSREYYHGP